MRKAFVDTLLALAARDERILLLTADMGYNALEPFAAQFPHRFYNVGVAEQNLLAVATGLAEGGFVPYCYSIAPFAVLRPYEFIRNGPILHRLPVRIVGMGGGLGYGSNGLSHHGIDDLGALRVQPGIALFAPADSRQTRSVLEQTAGLAGPAYYRLEKDDALEVPGLDGRFAPGRPELLLAGSDVLFVALGGIAAEAAAAARAAGAGVAIVSSLQPLDHAGHADLLRRYRTVIAVEAHYRNGALGSALAEVIAEAGLAVRLLRLGVAEAADGVTGSQHYLHHRHGLDRARLARTAAGLLTSPNPPLR